MRKFTTRDLSLAAIIAAVYAVLTLILPIPPFTGIQVRLSEALTLFPGRDLRYRRYPDCLHSDPAHA